MLSLLGFIMYNIGWNQLQSIPTMITAFGNPYIPPLHQHQKDESMDNKIKCTGRKSWRNLLYTRRGAFFSGLILLIIVGASFAIRPFVQRVSSRPGPSTIWSFSAKSGDIIEHSPIVLNNTIYLSTNHELPSSFTSTLYALDAASGKQKWAFEQKGLIDPVDSWPIIINGILYVDITHPDDDNSGTLYALDVNSGHEKWSLQTEDLISFSPTIVDSIIYVASHNTLYALNALLGNKLWTEQINGLTKFSPIVANGMIYVASLDSSPTDTVISALDAVSGHIKWSHRVESFQTAPLTVGNGIVYVETDYGSGTIYALDALSGIQKWSFQIRSPINATPTVSNSVLYISDDSGVLTALDASSGNWKWSVQVGTFFTAFPTIVNGIVYVVSTEGTLDALDALSGRTRWSQRVDYVVESLHFPPPTITVSNGTVYGNTKDGNLYTLNGESGKKGWSYQTQGYASVAPTVANGIVYVMSGDNLEAIQLPKKA